MLEGVDLKKKAEIEKLIRTYGYGEPDLETLLNAPKNHATFYFEEEIQPFEKKGSNLSTKEMLYFPLPVAKETLERMGEAKIKMRVTLSYFIPPNPRRRGLASSKFRYANCGLRFDLKTGTES